jgi:predicted Zn-ribbon and HTH transcriptional regulator
MTSAKFRSALNRFKSQIRTAESRLQAAQRKLQQDARRLQQELRRQPVFDIRCACGHRWQAPALPSHCPRCSKLMIYNT